jgi:hypothetical protein
VKQSLIRQQCKKLPRPSHRCQCRWDQLQNIRASTARERATRLPCRMRQCTTAGLRAVAPRMGGTATQSTRMSDPPDDRIVPIRSLQGARLDERFDATLADLEARGDELVRVISRLTEGLSVIDQAGADASAQSARDLIGLLTTAKAQLDEISAIIRKLRPP